MNGDTFSVKSIGAKTTIPMYGGAIQMEFSEKGHAYKVNGKRVSGVTTILGIIDKPALKYWTVNLAIEHLQSVLKPGVAYDEMQLHTFLEEAKNKHKTALTDAGVFGTSVHQWIEDFIAGNERPFPVNPAMRNAIYEFCKWTKEHNVQFLESEKIIYSRAHGYAGKFDFTAIIDGKKVIGDIKTSNGIYETYLMQMAGYEIAYTEEYQNEKIDAHILVHVPKEEGQINIMTIDKEDIEKNKKGFLHALYLRKIVTELQQKLKAMEE